MYGRKRVYGSRLSARSRSAKPKKAKNEVVPRFRTLALKTVPTIRPSIRTVLKYFDNFTINPGIGAAGVYQFSANSVFDPNVTGIGHQPVGFDQLMAQYAEFIVIGSTIKFMVDNINDVTALGGVFITRSNVTSPEFRQYVENGDGDYGIVNRVGNPGTKTFTHKCDLQKAAMTNVMVDPDWFGNQSANPAEMRYYQCVVAPMDFTSDMAAVNCCVEITYDVIFRDRVLLGVS